MAKGKTALYVYSLLRDAPKKSDNRTAGESSTTEHIKGMTEFTAYPPVPSAFRKMKRNSRALLLQEITEGHSAGEYFSSPASDPLPQTRQHVSDASSDEPGTPHEPKRRIKTTSGLIHPGRLPECKKLKIRLRPVGSSDHTH